MRIECFPIEWYRDIAGAKSFIRRRELDCTFEVRQDVVKRIPLILHEVGPELHRLDSRSYSFSMQLSNARNTPTSDIS